MVLRANIYYVPTFLGTEIVRALVGSSLHRRGATGTLAMSESMKRTPYGCHVRSGSSGDTVDPGSAP